MARGRDKHRKEVEAAILDTLIEGPDAGMTIFEIRSHVDFDIEALEPALAQLRDRGKITIEYGEDRSVIRVKENAITPDDRIQPSRSWTDRIRKYLFE